MSVGQRNVLFCTCTTSDSMRRKIVQENIRESELRLRRRLVANNICWWITCNSNIFRNISVVSGHLPIFLKKWQIKEREIKCCYFTTKLYSSVPCPLSSYVVTGESVKIQIRQIKILENRKYQINEMTLLCRAMPSNHWSKFRFMLRRFRI